ncbi:endo-1,4-beta-xylanase [Aurantiacibacter spongiae]|uniref:Beta-xylanase n=1 Tax=Aurantiacibacter spongiae TaxID=2488860 RepID=A0A3N5CPM1_9SPHN|nr:endo-1,4-beta-xylanase [Aurantiacibacter spongiae]RPF70934.1 glycosyl hydrolase [Aurantiacibacter spongiae]
MTDSFRMNRRGALAGLAALPLAACAGDTSWAGSSSGPGAAVADNVPTPSLDALARRRGRRFGSAIAATPGNVDAGSIQNPRYSALIKAECGLVVPENELKWQATRPDAATYDFARMDAVAAWARANEMELRGHTLLWHRPEWFPAWLNAYDFGAHPATEAERLISEHIRTVARRYGDQIKSWDVVNEAIDHDARATMETSLSRAMGTPESVIDLAFRTARDAMPDAQLVYNDYMSWEPQHQNHCADVLRLLEGMVSRGVPVDALGIQSHIEMFEIDPATGVGPYAERQWRAFLDEVTGMGLRLLITEFDVKDSALPAPIAQRDAKVADYTRRYFDLMLEYDDDLDDILAWGMVDRFNWLQDFEKAARPDGLEIRGAPYDNDYRPKPMRDAIAAALAAA